MNSLTIITVIAVGVALFGCFKWGYEVGFDRGVASGRRARSKAFQEFGQ